MDRRTLLAIALCFLIFMGWQKFYIEPRMPKTQTVTSVEQTTTPPSNNAAAPAAPATGNAPKGDVVEVKPTQADKPVESRPVTVGTGTAAVGSGPKIFTGWDLKSYKLSLAPQAAAVDLKSVTNQEGEGEIAFDLPEFAYLNSVRANELTVTEKGATWLYEDANIKLVREVLSNPDQPYADVVISAEFKTKKPNYMFLSLTSQSYSDDPEAQDRQLVYWTNQTIERVNLSDAALKEVPTAVKWIGATSRYFLMTFVANPDGQGVEPKALMQSLAPNVGKINLVYPVSGNSIRIPLRAYFGPKELNLLRSVEPTLDHTIDFGWFTIFAYPLLKLMKWLNSIVHNYGVAIILLTIFIKILTYPLTYKSMKSMKKMAALQPQLQKLRDKYKDDKEALNREMLTMMRGQGYNPVAGCLPIIIQMPVFFALYRVLYSSIELYHAPFALWIHDLSYKDPFYVTPVLLSLTMYVQQKLTPNTATDPAQAKMMQFMPLIFGAFMLTLPSGLTLYMLVNAIVSIIQQIILNKKLGTGSVAAVART